MKNYIKNFFESFETKSSHAHKEKLNKYANLSYYKDSDPKIIHIKLEKIPTAKEKPMILRATLIDALEKLAQKITNDIFYSKVEKISGDTDLAFDKNYTPF